MEFYYDKKGSNLYQQIYFPHLYWGEDYLQEHEGFSEKEQMKKTLKEELYQVEASNLWLKEMSQALKPYGKEIEKYYGKAFTEMDLHNAFKKVGNFFEEESLFTWLEKLMKVEEDTLRFHLLEKAWRQMEEIRVEDVSEKTKEYIYQVAQDMTKWSGFLEETQLPKEDCWRILQFLINPLESLKGFYRLHKNLVPILEKQEKMMKKAEKAGLWMVENLNRNINFLDISFSLKGKEIYKEVAQNNKVRVVSMLVPSQVLMSNNPPFIGVGYLIKITMKLLNFVRKMDHRKQAEVFKVLGDRTRYELLVLLTQGVNSTKELAKALAITSASVTYHLQYLIEADLIHINWRKIPVDQRINQEKVLEVLVQLQKDLLIQ